MKNIYQKTIKLGYRVPTKITGAKLTKGLQIFELKQMADMEATYRKRCLKAIQTYKAWMRVHASETDVIELLYGNLEGVMLRRQAQDAACLYWIIRLDFRRAFKEYLDKSCCYPSRYTQSKAA